jgi:hypothetical protein
MCPREREKGRKRARAPGWRRPAAMLDQPAADGVATPPRLANRRGRAASQGEREGADGWARVSKE